MKIPESDPVIDEIREVRHRISERFDHDPSKLVAHYMELQEHYKDRLIGAEHANSSTPKIA
jgi:hypothetical protein